MRCGPQPRRTLSRCVGSPNSKPHLMVTRTAIIDPDMGVTSCRELVEACDLHFLPAAKHRQFRATGTNKRSNADMESPYDKAYLNFTTTVSTCCHLGHSKVRRSRP